MVNTALRPDATLGEVLAAMARNASDVRLGVCAAAGILGATSAAIWQPVAWMLLCSACGVVAAFGLWGIADRELHDSGPRRVAIPRRVLLVARVVVAVAGGFSGLVFLAVLLGIALGRIVS